MSVSLFIAGDFVPKGVTMGFLCENCKQIFGAVKHYIQESDYSVVNLEAPIVTDKPSPIKKSGPTLGVAPATVQVLKDAGFSACTLANNHFLDQGQNGVNCTIDVCNELNIRVIGGGQKDC